MLNWWVFILLESNTAQWSSNLMACTENQLVHGLADHWYHILQFHSLTYFLDINSQRLHTDVVVTANITQISRTQIIWLLLRLKTLYIPQILNSLVNQIRQIQTYALLSSLIHVVEVRIVHQSTIHESPSQPINSISFVLNTLSYHCWV